MIFEFLTKVHAIAHREKAAPRKPRGRGAWWMGVGNVVMGALTHRHRSPSRLHQFHRHALQGALQYRGMLLPIDGTRFL